MPSLNRDVHCWSGLSLANDSEAYTLNSEEAYFFWFCDLQCSPAILLAEGLWIYGTSHISVLSEMCCKCFRYRLALAFKLFVIVSHWMQTGNSIFVFTVKLLVLFPEGHSYFHTWHQGKTFYSLTFICLWNKTKEGIALLTDGFIGQH